jgi:hypothetical protein
MSGAKKQMRTRRHWAHLGTRFPRWDAKGVAFQFVMSESLGSNADLSLPGKGTDNESPGAVHTTANLS